MVALDSAGAQDNVIILVPGFPGTEAETDCLPPVQNLVRELASRNPATAFHVISFQYPFEPRCYQWHGATVHALAGRNQPLPYRLRSWMQAFDCARRLIRSGRVVAVHSFWLAECAYVGAWISRLSRVPHIGSIHGQDALPSNPYLSHLPLNRMTITAGLEFSADVFRRATVRPVDHTIPTGLDAEALEPWDPAAPRDIDILGVGSMSEVKDYRAFVTIAASLLDEFPGLHCTVIGDGPERNALQRLIERFGIQNSVRLEGSRSRPEVLRTMRRARILLHPSQYEGQGYVFLEALAAGLRIVCRDVGFSGNGRHVVHCRSNREIEAALRRILSEAFEPVHEPVLSVRSTAEAFERLYGIG